MGFELGLYDYRARTYDPALGRFLQRDPGEMVDGTNLYAYTGNNPLTYSDSFGTEREENNCYCNFGHHKLTIDSGPINPERLWGNFEKMNQIATEPLPLNSYWEFTEENIEHTLTLGLNRDDQITEFEKELKNNKRWEWLSVNLNEKGSIESYNLRRTDYLVTELLTVSREGSLLSRYGSEPSVTSSLIQPADLLAIPLTAPVQGIIRGATQGLKSIGGKISAKFPRSLRIGSPITYQPITLKGIELELFNEVQKANRVVIGRMFNNLHLQKSAFSLDAWLVQNQIKWTPRLKQVYEVALYSRTAAGRPVSVMAGWQFTLEEAAAAELGAAQSGIKNIPFWPD